MNLRLGLIRLWIVASVFWIGWTIFSLEIVSSIRDPVASYPKHALALLEGGFSESEIAGWALKKKLFDFAQMAFVPPLVVLLVGIGLWWAVNGFKNRPKSN
jgi:hypothetical protein